VIFPTVQDEFWRANIPHEKSKLTLYRASAVLPARLPLMTEKLKGAEWDWKIDLVTADGQRRSYWDFSSTL
jgi:hypothetical protein